MSAGLTKGLIVFCLLSAWAILTFLGFSGYLPSASAHFISADPLRTPAHILPEWYLRPDYAMLRAGSFDLPGVNGKIIGLAVMIGAHIVPATLLFISWQRLRLLFWGIIPTIVGVLLGLAGTAAYPPFGWPDILAKTLTLIWYAEFLVFIPVMAYGLKLYSPEDEF